MNYYFYKLNLNVYDKLGQKHDFLKSKTKYQEVMRYTDEMVEYDILEQSLELFKLSNIRIFNSIRWTWTYQALRYFFLKCNVSFMKKICLMIVESTKFAPIVLFFSYKYDQQFLIGWTAGYYSNKFRIHRYVKEKNLEHLYNFTTVPGFVILIGLFLRRTEKALSELLMWFGEAFLISFTSLYDNYYFSSYNFLTSKTNLKVYFFLQLIFLLLNSNQKTLMYNLPKLSTGSSDNKIFNLKQLKNILKNRQYSKISWQIWKKNNAQNWQTWRQQCCVKKSIAKKSQMAKFAGTSPNKTVFAQSFKFKKPKRVLAFIKKQKGGINRLYIFFKKNGKYTNQLKRYQKGSSATKKAFSFRKKAAGEKIYFDKRKSWRLFFKNLRASKTR